MTYDITFPPPPSTPDTETLRAEVRAFLSDALKDRKPVERAQSWNGVDPAFSRALGQRGWLGMTWPKQYGGHERSALERYVVVEELLAAGAPVNAHWIADRQSGPALLKYGTEAQKRAILPRIAAGECYFCIGMSEPDTGSDLASARTRATETPEGWRINGTKIWTSGAHVAHYMILFCKTDSPSTADDRHGGASQFLVDMRTPGISVSPIRALTGEHHFNETHFDDVLLPKDALLGKQGDGWAQVVSELAFERSGPERFLSSFQVFAELAGRAGTHRDNPAVTMAIGRIAARMVVLRRMSRSVAGMLQEGRDPGLQAAIVKDLGAVLEQEIPEMARQTGLPSTPSLSSHDGLEAALAYTIQHAPSFSLRGGTREILRGIIARGLGLR